MTPEGAKAAAEVLCTGWQAEMAATAKVLSAVQSGNRDYKPDPKSRSAWELATHLATADVWFIDSIERGEFHFDPEAAKQAEARFRNVAEVAGFYEATIPARLARLAELSAEQLAEPLDFFGMMKMSRAAWIGFANNHSVHHRGQLSAYLRALGSKVPDIYGPSGDAEPIPAPA